MKRILLGAVLAIFLFPLMMRAQNNYATQTVRGLVCDVASGEPMIGVSITIEDGTTIGTVSDADGNFIINNVPVGRHSVRASYVLTSRYLKSMVLILSAHR